MRHRRGKRMMRQRQRKGDGEAKGDLGGKRMVRHRQMRKEDGETKIEEGGG